MSGLCTSPAIISHSKNTFLTQIFVPPGSPVCFILASYDYPGAIKKAWGRTVDEIDDETWEIMNGPAGGNGTSELGTALGMLVKMTRLHDLGLGQLCLGQELGAMELSFDMTERLRINI
jgi:hypothetical protein